MVDLVVFSQKTEYKVGFPTSWDEISFKKYNLLQNAIKNKLSKFEIISVLTGLDVIVLKNMIASEFELLEVLFYDLFNKKLNISNSVSYLNIGNRKIKCLDVDEITAAQYEDIKSILAKQTGDDISFYPLMIAIALFYKYYSNEEYDYKKAILLSEKIDDISCEKIISYGNFFLTNLTSLKNGTLQTCRKRNLLLKRLGLVLKKLQKGLGLFTK
ncbi:MAG: hypothetical protein QXW79_04110 [Thermoplasmata archaeon]